MSCNKAVAAHAAEAEQQRVQAIHEALHSLADSCGVHCPCGEAAVVTGLRPAQTQPDTDRDGQTWWVCVVDALSCGSKTCSQAPTWHAVVLVV